MQFANTVQGKFTDLPATTETEGEDAIPASILEGLGSEVSVILLGATLLCFAGSQFLRKLGKSMTSNASK